MWYVQSIKICIFKHLYFFLKILKYGIVEIWEKDDRLNFASFFQQYLAKIPPFCLEYVLCIDHGWCIS